MAKPRKGKRHAMTFQERRAKYASARKELSKLKSKGLVSPLANLRKAKPSSGLLKKLEILRPVLTGKAQAIRLPKATRGEYKDAGFFTARGFTIIHKNPDEKVVVNETGQAELVRKENKPGKGPWFQRVVLPVNVRRFDKFYDWLSDDPSKLQKLGGGEGAYFAFTFYGSNSRDIGDAEWLAEYLQHYIPKISDSGENLAFNQLVLYSMDYSHAREWGPSPKMKDRPGWRTDATGRSIKPKNVAERSQAYRERENARMRKYRAARLALHKV